MANLHDATRHALGLDSDSPEVRGKRIRPLLCLVAAEAMGASFERAIPFALAIELMHDFCLVHDDLEDGDRMRRGRPSVWVAFGAHHAVNAGDYLLVLSYRALLEEGELDGATRLRLARLLGETLDRTHVGQALDMNARGDRDFTLERYMRVVREKTGRYLAAPIQGGVVAAGADDDLVAKIGRMAFHLGPLFQIADDLIDLTEGKGREAPGSDIREGKRSYMVAFAAERCRGAERERLFDALDRPRDETTDEDVAFAIDLFRRHGALDAGREACRRLFEEARPILRSTPPALAGALEPIFEGLVARTR